MSEISLITRSYIQIYSIGVPDALLARVFDETMRHQRRSSYAAEDRKDASSPVEDKAMRRCSVSKSPSGSHTCLKRINENSKTNEGKEMSQGSVQSKPVQSIGAKSLKKIRDSASFKPKKIKDLAPSMENNALLPSNAFIAIDEFIQYFMKATGKYFKSISAYNDDDDCRAPRRAKNPTSTPAATSTTARAQAKRYEPARVKRATSCVFAKTNNVDAMSSLWRNCEVAAHWVEIK